MGLRGPVRHREHTCLVDVDIEASRFQWDDYGLTDLADLEATLALAQTDRTSLLDRFTEQVFAEPTDEMRALQSEEMSRTPAPIKSAILFDALTRDYRDVLPDVDVRMLVCAGGAETRGSLAAVRNVADLVPGATFERFEDSGHCPQLEEPERFNRVLGRFVDSL